MGTTLKVNSFWFSDRAVFPNYNWDLSSFTGTHLKIKTSVTTGFSQELYMANLACGYCSTKPLTDAEVVDGFLQNPAAPKATLSILSAATPLGTSLGAAESWDHCCLVCIHRLRSTHSFNPFSLQALQKQNWTLYKPNCILENYFWTWRPQVSSVTSLFCILQAMEAPGLTDVRCFSSSFLQLRFHCTSDRKLLLLFHLENRAV